MGGIHGTTSYPAPQLGRAVYALVAPSFWQHNQSCGQTSLGSIHGSIPCGIQGNSQHGEEDRSMGYRHLCVAVFNKQQPRRYEDTFRIRCCHRSASDRNKAFIPKDVQVGRLARAAHRFLFSYFFFTDQNRFRIFISVNHSFHTGSRPPPPSRMINLPDSIISICLRVHQKTPRVSSVLGRRSP